MGKVLRRLYIGVEERICCCCIVELKGMGMEILYFEVLYGVGRLLLIFIDVDGDDIFVVSFVKFLVYLWIVFLLFVSGDGFCCRSKGLLLKLYDGFLEL